MPGGMAPATAAMVASSPSMPVLIASAPMSASTQASWAAMKPGGTGWMAWTPVVSWAVSAVIAVIA